MFWSQTSLGEIRTLSIDSQEAELIELEPYLSTLQDKTDSLSIENIPSIVDKFTHSSVSDLVKIKRSDTFWIKFTIKNATQKDLQRYIYSYSTHNPFFQAYIFDESGSRQYLGDYGFRVPHQKRPVYAHHPTIPIVIPAGKSITFIARTKFYRSNVFKYQLQTKRSIDRFNYYSRSLAFIYAGCLGGLLLYNFFLYLTLRDKAYLHYIFFGISVFTTVFSMNGIFDLWGLSGENFSWVELGVPLSCLTSAIFVVFASTFLQLKKRVPQVINWIPAFVLIQSILAIALAIFPDSRFFFLSDLGNIFSIIFFIAASIHSIRDKYRPAKIFLSSWLCFMASVVYWTLGNHGLIYITNLNADAILIGSMLEMLLMSFALALRVKILQQEKTKAEIKAKEAEVNKRLLRVLCHDLANPLTVTNIALSIIDRLKVGIVIPFEKQISQIKRATSIIEDITLSVRKIESIRSGTNKYELEVVDLNEVSEQVVFIFTNRLKDKNLSLIFEPQNMLKINVLVEKTSFCHEVINNIISNAIKFSDSGGKITFKAEYVGEMVLITIEDQGVGMPKDIVATLFDPEESLSRPGTSQEKGTGFGMPIVKSYIDLFGGTIEVESRDIDNYPDDHGTKVMIKLQSNTAAAEAASEKITA